MYTGNDVYSGDPCSGNDGYSGLTPPDDAILFTVSRITTIADNYQSNHENCVSDMSFFKPSPLCQHCRRSVRGQQRWQALRDHQWCYVTLKATTVVAETTVVADIRGLTVFSAIDVVLCILISFVSPNNCLVSVLYPLRAF